MNDKLLSVKEAVEEAKDHKEIELLLNKRMFVDERLFADLINYISTVRREEQDNLICSECGFPPDIQRELVFLDSNPLSFLKCEANTCKKCGHQRDGSTIPIVAKKIREVVEHVQKRAREKILTIFNNELINPYSPEVFIEKTAAEWKKFHIALAKEGILGDGYLGSVARLAYSNAINDMKKKILEEK